MIDWSFKGSGTFYSCVQDSSSKKGKAKKKKGNTTKKKVKAAKAKGRGSAGENGERENAEAAGKAKEQVKGAKKVWPFDTCHRFVS